MKKSLINQRFKLFITCIMLSLFITGCKDQKQISPAPTTSERLPNTSSTHATTDKWIGKWIGPEGTFLLLAGGAGKYEITIQNLDGPRTFKGHAEGEQISFERDGVKEHLQKTNGNATGMKWLSEKTNCLTVRSGEGYCRD